MGVWDRIEDELIDKVFEEIKRHKDEKVKNDSFAITWDTVRDEYETTYECFILGKHTAGKICSGD